MKKKERETLAQQGDAELLEKEKQLREASWKLRLQKSTGQLEDPSRLRVLRRHGVEARATALAEAAIVDRQGADSCGGQLRSERLPRHACRVAHVQQQHRRARLAGGVERCLQGRAVGGAERHVAPLTLFALPHRPR